MTDPALLRYIEAEKRPLSLDSSPYDEDGEPNEFMLVDEEERLDRIGWSNLFHQIPQEQLEVMVCLFLGLRPIEIVTVLGFPNIARYYNVSNKLRKSYRLKKERFVD